MATNCITSNNNPVTADLQWDALFQMDWGLPLPLTLKLPHSQEDLICETLLRFVPKKRLVTFAKWGKKEVVAKLFFNGKNAEKNCARDILGIHVFTEANVPTPQLLYEGPVLGREHAYVIVLEKIQNAVTLDTCWRDKKSIDGIFPLMLNVTLEIATHHVLGFLQKDLHFKNFLITANMIYSLDGSDVKKYGAPLPKKTSIQSFALFAAQLGEGMENVYEALFECYAKSRGWIIKPSDMQTLHRQVQKIGQQQRKRHRKKIFRNCTAFQKIKTGGRSIVYDRLMHSAEFMPLLMQPDQFISGPHSEILKSGRSATVAKITLHGHDFIVKTYHLKNTLHALRRCFRRTRAEKNWALSQRLQAAGIPVPKPFALITHHLLGLRGKSHLIMEAVSRTHIGEYLASKKNSRADKIEMAKKIIVLLKQLKKMHITHGDLKMTNILIHQNQPMLIDLDGMREHRSKRKLARVFQKDLLRLLKNWQDYPDIQALFNPLLGEDML